MGKLFISYGIDDRGIVEALAQALGKNGVSIWWDRPKPAYSHTWVEDLHHALDECDGYVIVVGEGGVDGWLKAELYAALRQRAGGDSEFPIFPLLTAGADSTRLPSFLAAFQYRLLPESLNAEALQPLSVELSGSGFAEPERPRRAVNHCPFPGLAAFGGDDEAFFFGREVETAFGLHCLGVGADGVPRRWLQVEGPRGCGKTSLVQAGILPAIRKGWLGETHFSRQCRVLAPMRPGPDPVGNLATVLAESYSVDGGADAIKLFLLAGTSGRGLQEFFEDQEKHATVVLFVDQFEELLTLAEDAHDEDADEEEDKEDISTLPAFDKLLAEALSARDGHLLLVTTMRSDFVHQCARKLPRLHTLLNESGTRLSTGSLDEKTLLRVVERPAQLCGLYWDQSTLPRRLARAALNDPVGMPLLGNMLRSLWQKRYQRKNDTFLPARYYDALQGLDGSLAAGADQALELLDQGDREAALNMLLRLVHFGPRLYCTHVPRPRGTLADVAPNDESAVRVLSVLGGQPPDDAEPGALPLPRLVVDDGERVDLAHEILLQRRADDRPFWPAFYRRLERERDRQALFHRLQATARAWHAGRSRALADRRDLKRFRKAGPPPDDGVLRDFIAFSRAKHRRLRWSRIGKAAGGAFAGLALLIPLYLGYRYQTGAQLELQIQVFPGDIEVPRDYSVFLDGRELDDWSRYRLKLLEPGETYNVEATAEGFFPAAADFTPAAAGQASLPLTLVRRNAIDIPEMVVLPDGRFMMGSPGDEPGRDADEGPQREVAIRSFAIGRYEVRFVEYDAYARATGRDLPPDENWGRGNRPVIRVSWSDARDYAMWLSRLTGERYRLPTESEWEYAARGGTTTRFWWGAEPDRETANYAGGEWEFTSYVGSFEPNPFGLYDTAGNLWEWVEDCWHDSYHNAPTDGSAWLEANGGDCGRRVVRGGSWVNEGEVLRSANRGKETDNRFSNVGFRLAKEIAE